MTKVLIVAEHDGRALSPGRSRWNVASDVTASTRRKPASFIPRCTSGAAMKARQTSPVRRFSAITSMMPTLIAITSGDAQPVWGLKASVKP